MLNRLMKNEERIQLTEGSQKRDFIYFDDVVDAYTKIINRMKNFDGFFMILKLVLVNQFRFERQSVLCQMLQTVHQF